MISYQKFRLEQGIAASNDADCDQLLIDNAIDSVNLLFRLKSRLDWATISALLKHPQTSQAGIVSVFHEDFGRKLYYTDHFSADNLMTLDDSERARWGTWDAHLCLIYLRYGLPSLDLILRATVCLDENLRNQAYIAKNGVLRWAIKHCYLQLFERLLSEPRVHELLTYAVPPLRLVADDSTIVEIPSCPMIYNQIGVNHLIINRLMQEPCMRAAPLPGPDHKLFKLIYNGLKRAFWLDLQMQPGFDRLNYLPNLKDFAGCYLKEHPEWLNASFDATRRDKFIQDIITQVLSLGCFKPFFRSSYLLKEQWTHIDNFLDNTLPDNLSHFQDEEFAQARNVACRCLQVWQQKVQLVAEVTPRRPQQQHRDASTSLSPRLASTMI